MPKKASASPPLRATNGQLPVRAKATAAHMKSAAAIVKPLASLDPLESAIRP